MSLIILFVQFIYIVRNSNDVHRCGNLFFLLYQLQQIFWWRSFKLENFCFAITHVFANRPQEKMMSKPENEQNLYLYLFKEIFVWHANLSNVKIYRQKDSLIMPHGGKTGLHNESQSYRLTDDQKTMKWMRTLS